MTVALGFSPAEMMIVAAARELAGRRVCFVGVGLPNIACNLAQRTVASELQLVYEAGVYGARPARLPLSIGDPTIVSGATAVSSMFDLFAFYLQGGLVDVGFLGASQIDRSGTINTTVIGDYARPQVRLPGSGGACEIAINAREVFVIMRQSARSFVGHVDFRTSPGSRTAVVVTDLAVYRRDAGELRPASLHPGVTRDALRAAQGWPMDEIGDLPVTEPPTDVELRLIREELDPLELATGTPSVPGRFGRIGPAQA